MFGEKLNGTDPEEVIRNAFACFDENNSGKFDFELLPFWAALSGKLNEEYLREMLMTTGDRYTEEQVDELLREAPIDANGDFDYIEVNQASIFQLWQKFPVCENSQKRQGRSRRE